MLVNIPKGTLIYDGFIARPSKRVRTVSVDLVKEILPADKSIRIITEYIHGDTSLCVPVINYHCQEEAVFAHMRLSKCGHAAISKRFFHEQSSENLFCRETLELLKEANVVVAKPSESCDGVIHWVLPWFSQGVTWTNSKRIKLYADITDCYILEE